MLSFFLITGLLVLLALAFVVPVLLKNNQLEAEHFDEQNIQIARDRLEELRQDLENGRIGQQEFDQVKQELEDNLALDLSVSQTDSVSVVTGSSKGLAYTLLVAVPVVAAAIYSQVGEFGAITGEVVKVDNHMNQPPNMSMEEAVAGLKARLEMEPDNAEGWFMLARTYAVTEQYKEAAQAYEKTLELVGDNANLLLRYADMIIMSQGGQMSNQARDIILKAVELEPDNLQGLWMAGMVASTQGDYNKALSFWYRLEPMLKNDIDSLTQLREQISQVEKNLGSDAVAELKSAIVGSEPVTTAKAEITVSVSLDQALRDKIAATDTLFVYAKAMQGPPMPLAAVKHPVSALPVTVTLNDAMAMMPAMKLSNFDQVKILAVISKSGQPGISSGDLYIEQEAVAVTGSQTVTLVINRVKD